MAKASVRKQLDIYREVIPAQIEEIEALIPGLAVAVDGRTDRWLELAAQELGNPIRGFDRGAADTFKLIQDERARAQSDLDLAETEAHGGPWSESRKQLADTKARVGKQMKLLEELETKWHEADHETPMIPNPTEAAMAVALEDVQQRRVWAGAEREPQGPVQATAGMEEGAADLEQSREDADLEALQATVRDQDSERLQAIVDSTSEAEEIDGELSAEAALDDLRDLSLMSSALAEDVERGRVRLQVRHIMGNEDGEDLIAAVEELRELEDLQAKANQDLSHAQLEYAGISKTLRDQAVLQEAAREELQRREEVSAAAEREAEAAKEVEAAPEGIEV